MERVDGRMEGAFDHRKRHLKETVALRRTIVAALLLITLALRYIIGIEFSSTLIAIITFWLLSTFVLSFYLDQRASVLRDRIHLAYILLEVFILTSVSYLASGINWISPLLFSFIIIYANFWLKRNEAITVTAFIVFIYTASVLAEFFGFLPSQRLFSSIAGSHETSFMVATLIMLIGFFAMLTHASAKFAAVLNDKSLELMDANKRLGTINHQLMEKDSQIESWNKELEKKISEKTAELSERNNELEIINKIGFSLSTSLHVNRIISQTLDRFVRIFPLSLAEITLLSDTAVNLSYVIKDNRVVRIFSGADANRLSGSYVASAVKAKRPIAVDISKSFPKPTFIDPSTGEIRSLVIFPIRSKNRVIGSLAVKSDMNASLVSKDIKLMDSIINMIGPAIDNAQRFQKIKKLSDVDGVTGLFNRRFISRRLDFEVNRADRYGHEISIMLIDVDKLKMINDTLGHQAGDRALRMVSTSLIAACRNTDIIGRYGGDEFLVILPETDVDNSLLVADRIISRVASLEIRDSIASNLALKPTVSIGLASYSVNCCGEIGKLISSADNNLYRAKKSGGNRLIFDDTLRFDGFSQDERNFPIGA